MLMTFLISERSLSKITVIYDESIDVVQYQVRVCVFRQS